MYSSEDVLMNYCVIWYPCLFLLKLFFFDAFLVCICCCLFCVCQKNIVRKNYDEGFLYEYWYHITTFYPRTIINLYYIVCVWLSRRQATKLRKKNCLTKNVFGSKDTKKKRKTNILINLKRNSIYEKIKAGSVNVMEKLRFLTWWNTGFQWRSQGK